jgi:DNA-binding transcriptional regulator/RsmH inhibitor MraZ
MTINDKGRFSLPKDFHKPEYKNDGFIIFCDITNKKLRLTTKTEFVKYRSRLGTNYAKSSLDPQIYAPDEQWRGTLSATHRKLLQNPSEVKLRGMDWFLEICRMEEEVYFGEEIKVDMDKADEIMSSEFYEVDV